MPWTHFKITELGSKTDTFVDGNPASINTWYPSTAVLTTKKKIGDELIFGEPYDRIKTIITDGAVDSNENNVIINFPPNKTIAPESSNTSSFIANNTVYNLIDYIGYNSAVDRIKIISFLSPGEITLYGNLIYPNIEISLYDLRNLIFTSGFGIGTPYNEIKYQVGNADGYNPTEYEINFNISGVSNVEFVDEDQVLESGIYSYDSDFKIVKGVPFGRAQIELTVDLSPSAWPALTDNEFSISSNNLSYENNINVIDLPLEIDLDFKGNADVNFSLLIDELDAPVTGTVKIVLKSINNDPSLVSLTNYEINLNINIP